MNNPQLEEAAKQRYGNDLHLFGQQRDGFIEGAKWALSQSEAEPPTEDKLKEAAKELAEKAEFNPSIPMETRLKAAKAVSAKKSDMLREAFEALLDSHLFHYFETLKARDIAKAFWYKKAGLPLPEKS
jgi:hypothetical protein